MNPLSRFLRRVIVLSTLAAASGCGGGKPTPARSHDPRTPGQYFKEQQSSTMTPNGKIMTGTVADRDGKIEYATEDGKRWRVSYSKRADGTYQYGTPDEMK